MPGGHGRDSGAPGLGGEKFCSVRTRGGCLRLRRVRVRVRVRPDASAPSHSLSSTWFRVGLGLGVRAQGGRGGLWLVSLSGAGVVTREHHLQGAGTIVHGSDRIDLRVGQLLVN